MAEEPSVLDYVKSKLVFWKKETLHLPSVDEGSEITQATENLAEGNQAAGQAGASPLPGQNSLHPPVRFIWTALGALVVALIAQRTLEPGSDPRLWLPGMVLYTLSLALLVVASLSNEWPLVDLKPDAEGSFPLKVSLDGLVLLAPLTLVTYLTFAGGYFTPLNVILWAFTIMACLWAFWLPGPATRSWLARLWRTLSKPGWNITISRAAVGVILLTAVVLFFRFYRINQVPSEMISDHAEKILDLYDLLQGKTAVYFPRNTGREFLAFYMAAAVIALFHTGLTFLTLKLTMIIAGVLTLPYIYLLGKEVGSRRAGLVAFAFAGIAYWPNVISRFALRFALYPLFVAPTLYYLIRGIRTRSRNDFVLSGIALGIGLHGYTPIRVLPLVVVVAIALYLLHRQSRGMRKEALFGLLIITVVSFIIFLPLFRYAVDNPAMFDYRALTRLGSLERPLPGPAILIFLQNLWAAMTMFFWSNGNIWVHSIPYRPALDVISAALFFIGLALVIIRYIRKHNWTDLFLVVSIPMLMLPSILSLAFPDENPSLNRTAGAYVVVFVMIGMALDGFFRGLESRFPGRLGSRLVLLVGLVLFGGSALLNYDLVFNQYATEFTLGAWNTAEMGAVVKSFAETYGSMDTAWVVAYPYWVDTRLVGINAGDPTRDTAIWPDKFASTVQDPRAKLFLINPQDTADLQTLRGLYPQAAVMEYKSPTPGKDFIELLVPPQEGALK